MKYGCIGEHLKHSFSKEIHNALADYEYEIKEIPRDGLHDFMTARDFLAINVTIPYKELVIPYLHFIDEHARSIGAVNTIVNREGKLYGYNTDFFGMCALLSHAGIDMKGKKAVILGTGGTSKTAYAVSKALLAREIVTVSRSGKDGAVSYEELYQNHTDAEIIINTTPVGMFPNIYGEAADVTAFPKLIGVIDAVYNSLRTSLVANAKARGIAAEGGLYMLVAQGVKASEIFTDSTFAPEVLDAVFEKIKRQKENIVLIGMPASGKSTVGRLIAEHFDREFIDTDSLIEEKVGMSIPAIFEKEGKAEFRAIECEVIREVAAKTGAVIATGGGVPLREDNVDALKKNGRIYLIDRPLDELIPTDDRPLSSTNEALAARYNERRKIYASAADVMITAEGGAQEYANKIIGEFES